MLRHGSIVRDTYVIDHVERTGTVESSCRGHLKDAPATRVVVRELVVPDLSSSKRDAIARRYERLQRLSHRGLPEVRDFLEEGGAFYLVYDEVAGTSLESLAVGDAQRPVTRMLEWASGLAEILSYLHAHAPPFVYHTLRIDDIVSGPEGLSLAEFGVAHLLDDASRAAWISNHMASTGFAAPEAYDAAPCDVTADVYSLGAILYYALTRMPPVGAHLRRSGVDLMPVSDLVTSVNPDLDRVITRALETDPAARFASVRELEMALQASMPENACGGCGRARDLNSPRCQFCGATSARAPRSISLDAPTTALRATRVAEPLKASGEVARPVTRAGCILVVEGVGFDQFDPPQRAAVAQALDGVREEGLRAARRDGRVVHSERLSGGSWLLAFDPGGDAVDVAVHIIGAVRSWASVKGRLGLRAAIDFGEVTFTAEGRATGSAAGRALDLAATAPLQGVACTRAYLESLGTAGDRLRAWMPSADDAAEVVPVFPFGVPRAASPQPAAAAPTPPQPATTGTRGMRFRVADGAEKGRSVALPTHDVELGRGDPSDGDASRISFAEPTMSRLQARLIYDASEGRYTIEHEPKATNPTLFNDVAETLHVLAPGDNVRMGHMLLIFEADGE